MAPHADDPGIACEQFLLRALVLSKWIVPAGNGHRPTSDSIKAANYETSCFIEGEITIEQVTAFLKQEAQQHNNEGLLYQIDKGLPFARISVASVREQGLIIERRPGEAAGCANPQAHVVFGPAQMIRRLDYERAAKAIVRDLRTTIL